MARRNREINIFNMSLLDILCGALGAFCFMMLALLPYYKPPGAETATRENQQKTEELMKKIKEAGQKMDASPAVEDLRQLVEELRQQIQVMQGQLNQALSKNEELTRMNASLTAQNDALAKQNAALAEENEKLKEMLKRMTSADALAEMQKRIEQLTAKNAELAEKNAALGQRVRNLTPISISLRFDTTQDVDLCLEDASQGQSSRRFNPTQRLTPKLWPNDVYLSAVGSTVYTLPESPTPAEYRLFVNLVSTPEHRRVTSLQTTIYYGNWPANDLPAISLTPTRPWQLYGTIKKENDGKLSFIPASTAERDAIWTKLTGSPVPKEPPPAFMTPPPRPKLETIPEPSRRVTPVPGQWKPPTPPPISGPNIPAPARNP